MNMSLACCSRQTCCHQQTPSWWCFHFISRTDDHFNDNILIFGWNSRRTRYIIYSNALSTLQALQDLNLDNPLVLQIVNKLDILSHSGKYIVLCWIPSHVGIAGNEEADAASWHIKCLFDHCINIFRIYLSAKTCAIGRCIYAAAKPTFLTRFSKKILVIVLAKCRRAGGDSSSFGFRMISLVTVEICQPTWCVAGLSKKKAWDCFAPYCDVGHGHCY